MKACVFRTLDFKWKDKDGKEHRSFFQFRDDETQALRTAMDGFAQDVWEHSSGDLRIESDLDIIDKPLTGLMTSSDNGRMEGETGGDSDYRRPKTEKNWMNFYTHIMEGHVTRKMWRELSVTQTPDNPWLDQHCRSFLVLGRYDVAGKPLSDVE